MWNQIVQEEMQMWFASTRAPTCITKTSGGTQRLCTKVGRGAQSQCAKVPWGPSDKTFCTKVQSVPERLCTRFETTPRNLAERRTPNHRIHLTVSFSFIALALALALTFWNPSIPLLSAGTWHCCRSPCAAGLTVHGLDILTPRVALAFARSATSLKYSCSNS